MSLIDFDKNKLMEIAVENHKNNNFSFDISEKDSYFTDDNTDMLFSADIYEFDFENITQLKKMLVDMWEYQQAKYMESFLPACLASVYKYQNKKIEDNNESHIVDPFIYEF